MSDTSIAPPATREVRGLQLYLDHADDIETIAEDIYLVPSQDGRQAYRVQYGEHEYCSCPDHQYRGVNCVHIYAVGIALAKRRGRRRASLPCAACGTRRPRRELIEAQEDTATLQAGERVCRPCGRLHGLL